MFSLIAKTVKFTLYALIVFIGVVFAVSNRNPVDLTFYPLPYILSMPLFLFAIIILVLGLLIGWYIARIGFMGQKRTHKATAKRVAALENEINTLRTEQLIRPANKALPQQ